jgi:hypothetical protein
VLRPTIGEQEIDERQAPKLLKLLSAEQTKRRAVGPPFGF